MVKSASNYADISMKFICLCKEKLNSVIMPDQKNCRIKVRVSFSSAFM